MCLGTLTHIRIPANCGRALCRNRPNFIFLVHHKSNETTNKGVPHFIMAKGPPEQLRFKCNDRFCKHRAMSVASNLPDEPKGAEEEIPSDDRDVDLLSLMLEHGGDSGDENESQEEAAENHGLSLDLCMVDVPAHQIDPSDRRGGTSH